MLSKRFRTKVGDLILKFFVDRGDEWDWFIREYQEKEREEKKLRQYGSKLSRRIGGEEVYGIVFPIKLAVVALSAFDIKDATKKLLDSKPMCMHAECGNWSERTEVCYDAYSKHRSRFVRQKKRREWSCIGED